MATQETVYAVRILLYADPSVPAGLKQTVLELLERGQKSRCIYLPATDAASYCGVSRSTFLRHIAPLCKPIRVSSRTVRYAVNELDRVLEQRS